MELTDIGGARLYLRPGTMDDYVAKECLRTRVYHRLATFLPGDTWLDAGANIGAFALATCSQVARVACYEPDVGNYELLWANCGSLPNVELHRAALVAGDEREVELYVTDGPNKGNHTLSPKRGRGSVTVPAENVQAAVDTCGANCVKMDVEGAELELLPALDLGRLDEVVVEMHHALRLDRTGEKYAALTDLLRSSFPTVVAPEVGKKWTTLVLATRRK